MFYFDLTIPILLTALALPLVFKPRLSALWVFALALLALVFTFVLPEASIATKMIVGGTTAVGCAAIDVCVQQRDSWT